MTFPPRKGIISAHGDAEMLDWYAKRILANIFVNSHSSRPALETTEKFRAEFPTDFVDRAREIYQPTFVKEEAGVGLLDRTIARGLVNDFLTNPNYNQLSPKPLEDYLAQTRVRTRCAELGLAIRIMEGWIEQGYFRRIEDVLVKN